MTEKDYQEAINWLFVQAPNYQIDGKKAYKPGLENIKKLCAFFGNPQNKIKTIHIGGTNGKGSTSNMLSSVLQESGYNVGLYNSPHLIHFTERIKINGNEIDKNFVYDFIQKLKKLPQDIRPSFFEYTTIMAFQYFYQKNVDFAIIEVGLGGRLDATNIITPIVAAITNIALDHMNILGDTVEKIAVEKSGIIKENRSIISGEEQPESKNIIKKIAESKQSPFVDATKLTTSLQSDLKGNYQIKNIKVALAIIDVLRNKNTKISTHNIERGLLKVRQNTGFIGRWFQFSDNPLIICDTAHNKAGLEFVFAQLNSIPRFKHIILGFVKDKKIEDIIPLLPNNAQFYFVKPSVKRGRNPIDYEELLQLNKIDYQLYNSVQEGYEAATKKRKSDEMIFVGGSNFVVGDFLEKNL